MPVHTAPSFEGTQALDALVAELDKRGEAVLAVTALEGQFVVVTAPPARATARTEKRPASPKGEKR
jgi:hypothetical protein